MTERVYIITSGEYSDYSIDSVWTTREDAERVAGTWGRVEEYVLNDRVPTPLIRWRAYVDPDDGTIRVDDKPHEEQEVQRTEVWAAPKVWHRKSADGFLGEGYGPSPEHARKSLADALAAAKATASGLP